MPEDSSPKTTSAAAATWKLPDGMEDHLTMGALLACLLA
jgi:hypothetical protein